jgi:hypothetical protein
MDAAQRVGTATLALALAAALAGCGTPGAPLPPSLNLPDRVGDLAATRAGGVVTLTWTMPKKNTDKLLLKGLISARVCRREAAGPCVPVSSGVQFKPASSGTFEETLPASLNTGEPRAISYFVELMNRNGRSAGLSNAAQVLAGEAPGPVAELRATARREGVELEWTPAPAAVAVRLHRKLVSPPASAARSGNKSEKGPLAPAAEAVDQDLLVEEGQLGRAIDKMVRFGEKYEYRAQRVARATADVRTLELAGELSAPVRVEFQDVFPPAVPAGLVAVVTLPASGAQGAEAVASIDLSWRPNTEPDLAGYIVYRREEGGDWQRISPAEPLAGPAFRDTHVETGQTYSYAVSAVDQSGHESERSAEARETVPRP